MSGRIFEVVLKTCVTIHSQFHEIFVVLSLLDCFGLECILVLLEDAVSLSTILEGKDLSILEG